MGVGGRPGVNTPMGAKVRRVTGGTHRTAFGLRGLTAPAARPYPRTTQGSVQIVLIFRLLLKITVDWPFHAISKFL